MKIIAHRGGRGFGADNTLEAMEKAVRAGVRMIETDVRSTVDGRLLICHDGTVGGRVIRHTPYDEIKKHAPDRPLLDDILERLAGWVAFNLEIKCANARDTGETLEAYGILNDTVVTSFNRDIVREYKHNYPTAPTGQLYRMPYGNERKLHRALDIGAEFIAPHCSTIDEDLVRRAHESGLKVIAWTVNDEDEFSRLYGWGVDAIITDHYFKMRDLLK
ncbi:MAG: hypothetical protein CVT63_00865 [Candidatus Anoxymicrobium japonicum]|uniref:GP-PDE domain-containing protein n=1 Tax=Candidatus Anoxymicrobium japonicum TaxID=2013648 RepID=A0A2N3G8A6_9ACTN|nr:MAG: hypothetical protein CVT63_00865 [Candidatus Anoxymicrobium japonicum]